MNVTVATELVRGFLGYEHDEIESAVENAPVGSGGLVLLPYFSGERTPNVPEGKGVLYGLTPENFKAPNLVRATMEGATMGLNYGLNRLREMGVEPEEIRLTGGGSKNKTWRRIAADVFDTPVVCLRVDEGAAYGAALQALWIHRRSLGVKVSISEITEMFVELDEESRIVPDPVNVAEYRRLQRLQDRLSISLSPVFNEFSS
jgi:xylulokinase